jgi:hypothetical protein
VAADQQVTQDYLDRCKQRMGAALVCCAPVGTEPFSKDWYWSVSCVMNFENVVAAFNGFHHKYWRYELEKAKKLNLIEI